MILIRIVSLIIATFGLATVSLAALETPTEANRHSSGEPAALINGYQPKWWKEAIVYQVYPRSFKDSNGDGIGDLKGITSELDYIQGLGVNVIWLSPHYDSPNADNGYDIRDYRKVMTEFGTMADFDELLKGDQAAAHEADPGSGGQPHQRRTRTGSWRAGSPKTIPIATITSGVPRKMARNLTTGRRFSPGSAWKLDPTTGEYYLHLFAEKQPDLNWDNPKVRQEVYDLMKFWLDKGVDGFRMDVIPFISKREGLPDLPPEYMARPQYFYAMGPHLHEYLQEMNREVLSKYDVMTVGEAFGVTLEQTPSLVDERRNELDMIFNFDAVRLNRNGDEWRDWTLARAEGHLHQAGPGAGCPQLEHRLSVEPRQPARGVGLWQTIRPLIACASAKALATMVLTLKGTPFIYQGDELGMTELPVHQHRPVRRHRGEERVEG